MITYVCYNAVKLITDVIIHVLTNVDITIVAQEITKVNNQK